ncbi:hypothetical protein [Saccharopolyspora taberi]|uniref:Uncharacterized protein n=1 Tax=Saccharopolyspora taberi TaxID=60895 RepID=A0ABN3VGE2_9PSEU
MTEPPTPCARCGQPMVMSRQAPPGVRRHKSRRLCTSCYPRVLERGELECYPRLRRSSDNVLEEYQHLHEQGIRSRAVLASRLGLSPGALSTLLWRARRAGDERAEKPLTRRDRL